MAGLRNDAYRTWLPMATFQSTKRAGSFLPLQSISTPYEVGITMNLRQSFSNWRRYRETVNELGRLSHRELADLGIARSDIPTLARRAVR